MSKNKKSKPYPPPPKFEAPRMVLACDALSTDELFITDSICVRYKDIRRMYRYADGYRVVLLDENDYEDGEECVCTVKLAISEEEYRALCNRWANYLANK